MSQGEPERKTRRASTGPLSIGQSFGKYKILRIVGRGGKGIVYEALDTVLNRKVALKLVLQAPGVDPEEIKRERDRFLVEARLSAVLPVHPNIVSVYEAGDMEGQRYLAAELVIGRPMNEWKSSASQLRQVELLRDVAVAMAHAHRHGIIHRDLKPSNILVDDEGRPHVTDFGLARKLGDKEDLADIGGGRIQGTPLYISPEHALGHHKDVDTRADVWSLGVMLYEILAGRTPFRGEKAQDVLEHVVREPLPPLPPTDLARAVGPLCVKALAKDPARRLPSAEALAQGLTSQLFARAPGGGSGKNKTLILGAAAAAVVVVGLIVALLLGGSSKDIQAALADGDRHAGGKNWSEALRAYERALAKDPENPRALDGQKRSQAALQARIDEDKKKTADDIRRENDARSKEEREEFQRREDELKKRLEAARKADEEQNLLLKAQQIQAEERTRAAEEAARKAKEELAKKDLPPTPAVPATVPAPAPGPIPVPGPRPTPVPAVPAAPLGLPKALEDGALHFEAEDFTGGAKPVAGEDYKDNSPNPPGGRGYRGACDVDMTTLDPADGGGWVIGQTGAGEWTRYRFDGGGHYQIEMRYGRNGGQIHFEIDGKDATGPIALADPARAWLIANAVTKKLADGPHLLKLVWDSNQNVWMDWFRFRKIVPVAPLEGAALAEAVKAVRDTYKSDYSRRATADILALARRLLDEGRKAGLDTSSRFALLSEARDLGVLWGDPAVSVEAVDEMSRYFLVNGPALKGAALAAATKAAKASNVHVDIAEAWLALAEEMAEAEDFEGAVGAADKAQLSAKAGHDATLAAAGAAREKDLTALRDEFKTVQAALKTLAEKPEDPAANLVVGNYRCFARADWSGGLPRIAKGSDSSAAAAAKKDVESPIDPVEQAATGDRWREAAGKRSGTARARYESRALHWYEKGVDGLAGPARQKVAAAIETITKSLHGGESLGRGLVFWVEAGRDVGENPRDLVTGARGQATQVPTVVDGGVKAYQCGRGYIEYGLTEPVKAMSRAGSIFAWVKPDNRGGFGGVVDRGEVQTDDFGLWVAQGRIGAHFNWPENRPGGMAMSKSPLPAQRWIHIGFSWDEKAITFYLDGKEDGETPVSTMGTPQKRGTRVYVGSNAPGGHDYFAGLIGTIVLYNRSLAAGEVQQLYMGTRAKFR